mgnify:CR=1 FL=1
MFEAIKTIIVLAVAASAISAVSAGEPSGIHVGRIVIDGRDICNGTLVSPSVVLTAGHCIQPPGELSPTKPHRISFLIKSPRDNKRRLFSAIDVGLTPAFAYRDANAPGVPALQNDLALVKLDGIATRTGYQTVGDPDEKDGLVKIPAKLGRDRAPEGQEVCLDRTFRNGLMLLSCHRDEGFSGSPVFAQVEGMRRIVGVVTAKSKRANVPVLYAVVPSFALHRVVWKSHLGDHQIKSIARGGDYRPR